MFQPHPLLHENTPAHKALVAKVALRDCGFKELSCPPYSPDVHQFPSLKGHLYRKHFEDDSQLRTATEEWLYGQDKNILFEWQRKAW